MVCTYLFRTLILELLYGLLLVLMDGCLMQIEMIMMTIVYGLSTSPVQGFSLLVLALMSSVLGMVDIEQVIDEEGIIMIMVNHV